MIDLLINPLKRGMPARDNSAIIVQIVVIGINFETLPSSVNFCLLI